MYARFLKFEDEMTVISVVWREAQQFIDKYEKVIIKHENFLGHSLKPSLTLNNNQFN